MRRTLMHFPLLVPGLMILGCGDSTDFDAAYQLEATNDNRGPAKTVSNLLNNLDTQLRSREADPKLVIAETNENIESLDADAFGEKSADFQKIKDGVAELQKQVEANASRAQLQELSSNLKEQGERLSHRDPNE